MLHIDLPVPRFLAFLMCLMKPRIQVIRCLSSTSGTLSASTLHGFHWVIGRSMVSQRLPTLYATKWTVCPTAVGHPVSPILLTGSLSSDYINSEYRVICRQLTVVAHFQVRARTRSTVSSSANSADESWSLAIPNPLKSLGSKISEDIAPRNANGTAPV